MKNKFKNWLKNWLLKDELESLKKTSTILARVDHTQDAFLDYWTKESNVIVSDLFKRAKELLESELGDVAIDIHERSPSWAVISIQGKKASFVKFVDLADRDIREIRHYFRRFEQQRINPDMPNGMPKDMFFKI